MIDELARELTAVGIRGRRRDRILAEFADHLACDPAAELGDPHEIAAQFADELAIHSARLTAFATFAALAGVAFAVGVPQLTLPTVPDIAGGRSLLLVGPATLAMVIGAQVAFAAGCLAALRALRLGGPHEVALVRRRIAVALASGSVTAAGGALYAVNFWGVVPHWWAVLAIASAAAAAAPLGAASIAYARAGGVSVSNDTSPRGLTADLGPLARPWLIGAAAALAMVTATSILERSLLGGLLRGGFEAILFIVCFGAFRRPLGLSD